MKIVGHVVAMLAYANIGLFASSSVWWAVHNDGARCSVAGAIAGALVYLFAPARAAEKGAGE